ncbi:MAG: ABC transporter permease [bacterium]
MDLLEGTREALETLAANKLRSALTMLGVMIGVAAVIAVVAVGEGGKAVVINELEGWGTSLIWVNINRRAYGERRTINYTYLDERDIERIRGLKSVVAVSPISLMGGVARREGRSLRTELYGISGDYDKIRPLKIVLGRSIEEEDDERKRKVCVLRPEARDALFGKGSNPIGQSIFFNGMEFTVVGVTEEWKRGITSDGTSNRTVFIPYSVGRRLSGDQRIGFIFVRARDASVVAAVEDQIRLYLRNRYGQVNGKDRFRTHKMDDLIKSFDRILGTMALVISAIAAISLLVGGVGIMNIMLVSVAERTREIGVRKAVGARWRDILLQFLVEAVILCLISGAVGISLGVGGAFLVSHFAKWPPLVSPGTVALSFGVAIGVGLLFGVYPASSAARLDPVAALREE